MYSAEAGDCPDAVAAEKKRCRKTGNASSESEALQIMSQFDELYKCRIAEVESDNISDSHRNELRLKIMNDWVKDLRDQNAMLVQTVHDLEKAAVCRVKLLEDKLQETSLNISQDMLNSDKSEDDLKQLSGRVHTLVENQINLECRIKNLQSDIDNLLELIKRGQSENDWSTDGLTFYEIEPSDIPQPINCICDQISSIFENEDNDCSDNHHLDTETLRVRYECKMNSIRNYYKNKCRKAETRLACLEKEACESRNALVEEVAQKHDEILALKNRKSDLKKQLCDFETKLRFQDEIIEELRKELKQARQVFHPVKKVKMNSENTEDSELNSVKDRLHETTEQLEDLKHILDAKNNEIKKLKDQCSNVNIQNQDEIVSYLSHLVTSLEKDNEDILSLKLEYETVLKNLLQTKHLYENNVALINEKLQDIESCLHNYRKDVIEQVSSTDNTKEFISSIENKITCIKSMFQNKCEMCIKENVLSGMAEINSKIISGIKVLSKIHERENKTIWSIRNTVAKRNFGHHENIIKQNEQKAIFEAIMQQFRMMEEFRICTVEVQAATEDLQEEIVAVVSNFKTQHCKYVELTKMITQVQDYFVKTRESINEVINRLELQDQEKTRNNQRLINNKIRLKDIKNDFNQKLAALSQCLNNQHSSPLGYTEIYTCNDLLISVIEEVEQISCNLQTVKSQDFCSLTTVRDLSKQLSIMENNIKELKKKFDTVLIENEIAQKKFTDKSKRLEKYEAEVDCSHTKMQDVLENIIDIRNQMNEFGCIKESKICSENTNIMMDMKSDLRRLQKECDALKNQIVQATYNEVQNKAISEIETRNNDLQDKIKVLQNEIKCKQEANIFLKQNLELLEKELDSTRLKAEDCRKISSSECLSLKKKIFELKNSLKVKKDTENNVNCLEKNETDSKKLQHLDYANVPQLLIVLQDTIHTIQTGLQELSDNLKRLVSEGSAHGIPSKDSIWTAIELLKKYVESIKLCSFDVEKIKTILYSKDKLMENMNEIIEIQKDSISISQSEVEDLHRKLQEKIEAQEQIISQYEKEKRKLNKQIELQVQTIGHLQTAVVEAKKTIDQLNNKATSDNYDSNQKIRSLNLYLTEVESQYNDCFGEEEVKNQNAVLNELKSKVQEFSDLSNEYEQKYKKFDCKYQEANKQLELLRSNLEDSKKNSINKQHEIDKLTHDNTSMKKRLEMFKLDFDLIEEEMKKLGLVTPSIENFKIELETMRSENDQFRSNAEQHEKTIKELRISNQCLTKNLNELRSYKDAGFEKYNEKITCQQKEINSKNEKIKNLNNQITYNKKEIHDQLQVIEELKNKLCSKKHRLTNYCTELDSATEKIQTLKNHIGKLERILEEKNYRMKKFMDDNKILKNNLELIKSELRLEKENLNSTTSIYEHELTETRYQLSEVQRNYQKALQDLNSKNQCLCKIGITRCSLLNYQQDNMVSNHDDKLSQKKSRQLEEVIDKLTKDLEDSREKLASKNEACSKIQTEYDAMMTKYETADRTCQRQKDELMLLEKKLTCTNQKFQNCTNKNDELIRQNKLLEENYSKCMTELEDIMLQLEDMQSSLVELRNECDAKTKSLDDVSTELDKMRVSRSEVCEESQYVLQWVRFWMSKQKQTTGILQDKLSEKHRQLLRVSAEKRNFMITVNRLRRKNKILTKRIKIIRKPVLKPTCIVTNGHPEISEPIEKYISQRCGSLNGLNSYKKESNAVLCRFRRAGKEKSNPIDIVTTRGDSMYFNNLGYLSKQLPKSSQIRENNRVERKISEDTTDHGYQTSSSK